MTGAREYGLESRTSDDVTLLLSNMSLPERVLATAGVGRLADVLGAIQGNEPEPVYDGGYELTPTRCLAASIQVQGDKVRDAAAPHKFASAVHQAGSPDGPVSGLGSLAVMPQRRRSIGTIAQMSYHLGTVPAVVLGDERHRGELVDFGRYGFRYTGAALTPEVYQAYGSGVSEEAVHDSFWQRSIRGVVFSPYDMTRAAANNPSFRLPLTRVIDGAERYSTMVNRIHVAVGKAATKDSDDRRETMLDLQAALQGPEALGRRAIGDIMAAGYEIWRGRKGHWSGPTKRPGEPEYRKTFFIFNQRLPVTIDMPHAGLEAVRGGPVDTATAADMQRTVAAHVRAFFRGLR